MNQIKSAAQSVPRAKPGFVILSIAFAIPALMFASTIVRILLGSHDPRPRVRHRHRCGGVHLRDADRARVVDVKVVCTKSCSTARVPAQGLADLRRRPDPHPKYQDKDGIEKYATDIRADQMQVLNDYSYKVLALRRHGRRRSVQYLTTPTLTAVVILKPSGNEIAA